MLKKPKQSLSASEFLKRASLINDDPALRIEEPLRSVIYGQPSLLQPDQAFFDVHAHSFTMDHIPKDFIKILNWVSNRDKARFLQWIDKRFGILMGLDNPKKVMDNLVSVYDQSFQKKGITPHLFIVNLAMDMERGISGAPTFNYKSQLEQLLDFCNKKSPVLHNGAYDYKTTILPFLAIDANNPDAYEYFLSGFRKNYNTTGIAALDNAAPFIGVKLYPSLGYLPMDPVLMDIYEICEAKSIPITTHCGGIRTRTSSRKIEVAARKLENGSLVDKSRVVSVNSKKEFKNIFLDPLHWRKVVDQFPKLKLNLAHFGDNEEWKKYHKDPKDATSFVLKTLKMMEDFVNVYADISYSYFDDNNRRVITAMMQMDKYRDKILHGSDFFMTEIEKFTTRQIIEKLEKNFEYDRDGYHLLTAVNPYNFLFRKA